MAASARLLPKQVPTDVWSLKEKLALACSVKRSGDNNWVSVSRAIKPYGEENRPNDWFSQKNCALQYSDLLDKVETPKRKRGEREVTEAPGDVIVRKLTIERIEELKRVVQEEQKRYKKLKEEVESVGLGHEDDKLTEIWDEIEKEKKEAEDKEKKWLEVLAAREQAKLLKTKKPMPGQKVKVELDDSTQDSPADVMSVEEDSNLSLPSASTPLSGGSQDVKPSLSATVLTLDQSLQGELEPKSEAPEEGDAGVPEGVAMETVVQTTTENWIPASDIKTEPIEVDILTTTIKEEVVETEEIPPEDTASVGDNIADNSGKSEKSAVEKGVKPVVPILSKLLQEAWVMPPIPKIHNYSMPYVATQFLALSTYTKKSLFGDDISEDDVSTIERSETPVESYENLKKASPDKERDIFVHVLNDKEDKDCEPLDSTSEAFSKDDDQPLSPASSVMSNDTDAGSFVMMRGRGRPSRGGKNRSGRRSRRLTRNRMEEDKMKESETSSKAESSDDDGGDTTLPESDDTASNATGKLQQSFCESVPNSPASIAPGDTEDEKAHKVWKKSIMLVWRAASNHKYANVFSHPVTEEIAPGYHSVVFRPLDLSQVKKNIENGQIRTTAEFQRDMMLMFTNAIMYNNSDHDVFHMATEMYDDVMRHIEIMVQGSDTKLLRTSRRSEAHSDKEDEPKGKRQRSTTMEQDGGKLKKRSLKV